MPINTHPSPQRLPFLDALRGLAALQVIMFHVVFAGQMALPFWTGGALFTGKPGVEMFFLVSAFSLCLSSPWLLESTARDHIFWLRRLFRILPLFYAMLVFTVIHDSYAYGWHHAVTEILASIFVVFNMVPGHILGIVSASWTIGVEMLFYAIFPLIFRATRTPYRLAGAILAAILLAHAADTASSYLPISELVRQETMRSNLFNLLPLFLMGIAAFDIHAALQRRVMAAGDRRDLGRVLILAGCFVFYAWLNNTLQFPFVEVRFPLAEAWFPGTIWPGIGAALLILGFALCPTKVLVNRVTDFLGRISYSMYLVHSPINQSLGPVYAWIKRQNLPATPAYFLALGVSLAVIVPVAVLTYTLIEKPGMRLGRAVIGRVKGAAAV